MFKKKLKLIFCTLATFLLFSGCIGTDIVNELKVPKIIEDAMGNAWNFSDSVIERITFEVDIEPLIDSMNNTIHKLPDDKIEIKNMEKDIINEIADLPKFEDETLTTFEGYKQFAGSVNILLDLLNKECGFDFDLLKKTNEEYSAIINHIERFTPLVENYNDLIDSANEYDENNEESVKNFYVNLGVFGFEVALIFGHVWYKTTYKVVGAFYRISGLNRLAFKCPTLISVILSTAHWELRNKLVDETSNLMKRALLSTPGKVLFDLII